MKYLFLVHSPTTFLSSVSVINALNLSGDNAVIIFFEFEKISSLDNKYKAVALTDVYPKKNSFKKLYYYFKYFNVINRIDNFINIITNNQKFTAYIPVLLFAGKALVTHSNCIAFNFIEEGLVNYFKEETLNSMAAVNARDPWRSNIFTNTKLLLSEVSQVLRGYNFKLQALPFSYSAYISFNNVLFYGLSNDSFPLINQQKKTIVPFQQSAFNNIAQLNSFDINNSIIWIGDAGVYQYGFDKNIYLNGIEKGCINFVKHSDCKKIFIKFHRDESSSLREAVKGIFIKHAITFVVIEDSIVLELLLFKAEKVTLIGVYSSLLFYAAIMQHKALSIYNFLKPEYSRALAGRDFSFYWNKVELIEARNNLS